MTAPSIVVKVQKTLGRPQDVAEITVDRVVLVAHLIAHHPSITTRHRATRRIVRDHLTAHYRTATATKHRHEPLLDPTRPSSPNNRPRGWYTGEGCVTREEDYQAFLAKHPPRKEPAP